MNINLYSNPQIDLYSNPIKKSAIHHTPIYFFMKQMGTSIFMVNSSNLIIRCNLSKLLFLEEDSTTATTTVNRATESSLIIIYFNLLIHEPASFQRCLPEKVLQMPMECSQGPPICLQVHAFDQGGDDQRWWK